ncbi:MAG: fluoride efflux transporter CrcB [Opitutus sp.]|nr:fluoride efflux transporter CrcB [Opitutus sp.]
MNPAALLWIALGGALGSVARALIGYALQTRFPWATLVVNIVGSFILGWTMTRLGGLEPAPAVRMEALVVVGFCGGFTTFSTFSWQTLEQMLRGQWGLAAVNLLLSIGLCLAAVWLGMRLGRA